MERRTVRQKKKRNPKVIALWGTLDVTVLVVILVLLFHKPAAYQPGQYGLSLRDPNQVGQYLPYLASELYNGCQTQRPFDLWIAEKPANQVIAGAEWEPEDKRQGYWPRHHEGILFSTPVVSCDPNRVTLMGELELQGAKLVVTIALVPIFDDNGRLTLHVDSVKVGALNITLLARVTAQKMYQQRLKQGPVFDDIRTRIAASLLNEESFEPIFPIDGRQIRLTQVHFKDERLGLRFEPMR